MLKIYSRLYNPKIPLWHEATFAIRGWKSCQHRGKNILLKLKTLQKQLSHSFAVKVVQACYPLCLWTEPGTRTRPLSARTPTPPLNKNRAWSIEQAFLTQVLCSTHPCKQNKCWTSRRLEAFRYLQQCGQMCSGQVICISSALVSKTIRSCTHSLWPDRSSQGKWCFPDLIGINAFFIKKHERNEKAWKSISSALN